MLAYRDGIFPWPIEGLPIAWFCPPERAILRFEKLHVPRSLARAWKKAQAGEFHFTVDQAFPKVISACAKSPRPGQDGTWIIPPIVRAYQKLHELGNAHSVEVWKEEKLVGGIYGVEAFGTFAAESMFYHLPNASKLALLFLIEHLRTKGLEWLDIQMMTPHMEALGAETISRDRFLQLLRETQAKELNLF